MTDSDALAHYVRTGDPAAFRQVVEAYEQVVYHACLRTLGRPADAEEAAQETFVKLARAARTVHTSVGAWLHACAVRTSIDLSRRQQTRVRYECSREACAGAVGADDPADAVANQDLLAAIDAAIARLPSEDQHLVVEHYLRGRPLRELAEETGVAASTVFRRVKVALAALRRDLQDRGVQSCALPVVLTSLGRMKPVPDGLTAHLAKVSLSGVGSQAVAEPVKHGAGAGIASVLAVTAVVAVLFVALVLFIVSNQPVLSSSRPAEPAVVPSSR